MQPPAARGIAVRVPATTANLGPGFDAYGAALSLHLHAELRDADGAGGRVVTAGEGRGDLATTDDNLLWRAFLALCAHAGRSPPDVGVAVSNAIPLERGLGSSSAAIVAGMGLAREALGVRIGDLDLVRLAAEMEGHPDNVAPAVVGGLVCVTPAGDGGAPTVRRVQPHARLVPVVFVPRERQSTSEARASLPERFDREDVATQAARAGHVIGGLAGLWPVAPGAAVDRVHEPARVALRPQAGVLLDALRGAGIHAWLSGAGPSVAAAVADRDAGVRAVCDELGRRHGFGLRRLRWDLAGLVAV